MEKFVSQEKIKFENSSWKAWVISSIASIIILTVAIILMKSVGLFEIPSDDTGAKTIAAALALIGSIVAAVITLIGTVVKYSIDDRNAHLAVLEANRSHALAIVEHQRNRTETAIRAVNLLSDNNKDTTPHQIGGALLALVSLNEIELAVSLLAELWPAKLASCSVAELVLRKAFESENDSTINSAATTLYANADSIFQPNNTHLWPLKDDWNIKYPNNARTALVLSAITWMKTELSHNKNNIPNALPILYEALADPEESIRTIAASSLRPCLKNLGSDSWITTNSGILTMKELNERFNEYSFNAVSSYSISAEKMIEEVIK